MIINFLKRKKIIYDRINIVQKDESKNINYKRRNNEKINVLIKNDLRKTVIKEKLMIHKFLSFSNIKLILIIIIF